MIDTNNTIKAIKVPFTAVPQFSKKDVAYVTEEQALRSFYKYEVGIDSFAKVIEDKQKDNTDRNALANSLQRQYTKLETTAKTEANIESLREKNTFTLITAHQPSLFTGPLYYIYKIVSVINLSKKLSSHYPNYQFVPVFITGGEDHDFDEVNHVHLFNKTLIWENEEHGSVGMMNTKSLKPVIAELKEILGESERAAKVFELMSVTHSRHELYSDAVIDMVNEIFGKDGLVIANMNHPEFKKLFIPEIKKEIFENPSIDIVGKERDKLEALGYKPQAFPREINFFYLRDQIRERITFEEDTYEVLNTDYTFSREEMETEIENYPERFSPNVIMRPLYQEKVFPNLAYIGGGGEIAYWLERKTQFEHFGINFPMLIRRDSVLWVDKGSIKKMNKLGLEIKDLFQKEDEIIRQFVDNQATEEISLNPQKEQLSTLFDQISELASKIDPTVAKSINAEHAKQQKVLDQIESRIHRAEKQKHDTAIKQIRGLKDKLFPKDGLQERYDNFMAFYFMYGDSFIETLKDQLDPLEKKMTIILDEH